MRQAYQWFSLSHLTSHILGRPCFAEFCVEMSHCYRWCRQNWILQHSFMYQCALKINLLQHSLIWSVQQRFPWSQQAERRERCAEKLQRSWIGILDHSAAHMGWLQVCFPPETDKCSRSNLVSCTAGWPVLHTLLLLLSSSNPWHSIQSAVVCSCNVFFVTVMQSRFCATANWFLYFFLVKFLAKCNSQYPMPISFWVYIMHYRYCIVSYDFSLGTQLHLVKFLCKITFAITFSLPLRLVYWIGLWSPPSTSVSSDLMVLCKCFFLLKLYFTLPCRGLGLVRLALYLVDWPTAVLQCFVTAGWVIRPVETVPNMTYNVFGGMLNPTLLLLLSEREYTSVVIMT